MLDFKNMAPGAFGGFVNMTFTREWDERWDYLVGGSGYCCTGGNFDTQWDYVFWRYLLPQRLVARARDVSDLVQVPFLRPYYCDDRGRLNADNEKYVQLYKNHPCNYLLKPGS